MPPIQRPRPRPWQRRRLDDRQGPHHAHRHQRGPGRARRADRADARQPSAAWPTTIRPTRTRSPPTGSPFRPLYDDKIMFNGQPIALVVAETPEIARLCGVAGPRGLRSPRRMSPTWLASAIAPSRRRRRPIRSRPCSLPPKPRGDARPGAGRGRRAPRGRILRADRASQPDGALCLDGDRRARRQAHGLRQDPGRAERAQVSVQRVRHEAGGCARHVAVHGRRVRLGTAPAVPGGAGGARGARACGARCASC